MSDISSWTTSAGGNNFTPPDGWPEGMAPSAVNDTAREGMGAIRRWYVDAEWINWGHRLVQQTANSFLVSLTATQIYTVGRRVKLYDASTVYGEILGSSPSGANTLVTVSSSALTSSLTSGAIGILNPQFPSYPSILVTALPPMWLQGLIQSNNVADATNDIDISAGNCRDATNAQNIVLTAITKRLDAAWAVGTNQGGLDTGAIGNSDYYIWAIKRSDTGVTDVLFSLSSTAPTMPANYDFKRIIGWFKRVGGTIVAFHAYEREGGGLELLWDVPTLDIALVNTLTTSRRTDALKVPLNFSTIATFNVLFDDTTGGFAWIYCPDQTDAAPAATATAPLANVRLTVVSGVDLRQLTVRTDATGKIAARANVATVDSYAAVTLGFLWARR